MCIYFCSEVGPGKTDHTACKIGISIVLFMHDTLIHESSTSLQTSAQRDVADVGGGGGAAGGRVLALRGVGRLAAAGARGARHAGQAAQLPAEAVR